jgi:prophage maintenance system killer protein
LAVALAFLALNDIEIDATDDELVTLVLSVAGGRESKAAVAEFLRAHCR